MKAAAFLNTWLPAWLANSEKTLKGICTEDFREDEGRGIPEHVAARVARQLGEDA
jgi:hypothetical protein